jgi:hypothetical protein
MYIDTGYELNIIILNMYIETCYELNTITWYVYIYMYVCMDIDTKGTSLGKILYKLNIIIPNIYIYIYRHVLRT